MGIFQRTADIVAANMNDFVDRFEPPERMLRHALSEMETLVATTSSAVARSIAAETLLSRTRGEHRARVDDWRQRAAAALAAGDEALARRAITRQVEYERCLAALDRQLDTAHVTNETLRRQLDVLRDKCASARSRLLGLSARQAAADAQRQVLVGTFSRGCQQRALARFERLSERVEFAEAEAAALVELETGAESLAVEFERRATEQAIDEELARLKARTP